jgi:hypothetical protein
VRKARRVGGSLVVAGLVLAGLVVVPGAGADQAGPVVAGEDAYVSSSSPTGNFDTSELRARNTSSPRIQSYLKFDLGDVPPGATNLRGRCGCT